MPEIQRFHLDIETGDPDDLFVLAVASTHPRVDLRSVTVYPGDGKQVGLVRTVLRRLGRDDVKVAGRGGKGLWDDGGKNRVGAFYERWLGQAIEPEAGDDTINMVTREQHRAPADSQDPQPVPSHLLTGGPINNVWDFGIEFRTWTCQGGFVGESWGRSLLEKFKGKEVMATYNLGGSRDADSLIRDYPGQVRMVGKNVCHAFTFSGTSEWQRGSHPGLDLALNGFALYFQRRSEKAMHDLLALSLAIDPSPGAWVIGEPYREKGQWGFRPGGRVLALVDAFRQEVIETLHG